MTPETRFEAAWTQVGGAAVDGQAAFADLTRRYAEPHRAYHTLEHVLACLREFDQLRAHATAPSTVELAIWFHDAVYNPRSRGNEEQSARLAATSLLRAGVPAVTAQRVSDLIRVTASHEPGADADAEVLCDVDLSILGADPGAFAAFDAAVAREYAHVPRWIYGWARRRFLRRLLARPMLYRTEEMRARLEARARANLRAALGA